MLREGKDVVTKRAKSALCNLWIVPYQHTKTCKFFKFQSKLSLYTGKILWVYLSFLTSLIQKLVTCLSSPQQLIKQVKIKSPATFHLRDLSTTPPLLTFEESQLEYSDSIPNMQKMQSAKTFRLLSILKDLIFYVSVLNQPLAWMKWPCLCPVLLVLI